MITPTASQSRSSTWQRISVPLCLWLQAATDPLFRESFADVYTADSLQVGTHM
jgi:hypothetical protein